MPHVGTLIDAIDTVVSICRGSLWKRMWTGPGPGVLVLRASVVGGIRDIEGIALADGKRLGVVG